MKRKMLGILPLIVGGSLVLSGCVYSHREPVLTATSDEPVTTTRTTRTVVVNQEPPAPRTEVMGPAPTEESVWVGGYWNFTDNRWVWLPGHWETRPRVNAIWVPGHWDKNPDGRGWSWTPGYWE